MNLRTFARGQPCVLCNTGQPDDTVILAHLNVAGEFGMGLKAADFPYGVWLCCEHHAYIDGPGRNDWKTRFICVTRQMREYARIGALKLEVLP